MVQEHESTRFKKVDIFFQVPNLLLLQIVFLDLKFSKTIKLVIFHIEGTVKPGIKKTEHEAATSNKFQSDLMHKICEEFKMSASILQTASIGINLTLDDEPVRIRKNQKV